MKKHARKQEQQRSAELRKSDADRIREIVNVLREGVWTIDTDNRTVYVNPVLAEMLGYTPEEMLGKTVLDFIAPEFQERVRKNLEQRRQGMSSLHEFEFRRKDGKSIVLSLSTAPLKDANGNYAGTVAAFSDFTESGKLMETLRANEERLRALYSSMAEGLAVHDMVYDGSGKAVDYRIVEVNPAFEKITGVSRDRAVSALASKLYGTGSPPYIEVYAKVAETGAPTSFETTFAPMGKTFNISVFSPGKGKFATVFSDITERKRVEQSLREEQERLKRSQEIARLGSWELDLVNNRLSWSDEVYRIFGLQPQEFGATYEAFLDHIHPDDRTAVDAAYIGSVQKNLDSYDIEHRVVRENTGEVRYVHERCEHYRDSSGKIVRSVGMVHDITEHKKREEELGRLNRTLKALSNSSKAMMRATDEFWYLNEVCRIITEDCGHAMVWIGYTENDKGKNVRPIAYAGFEEGYLETLNITWADTERGRGPTGTAIRTGKVSMCRNMLTGPEFKPWRAEALKRGYASSIVLPLMSEGKAFGAVNIYSRDPDPFSESEVALLTELTDDLAYGIEALRIRAAREKAEEALQKAKDGLEVLVQERTVELKKSVETVGAERRRFNEVLNALPAYVILLTPDYHVRFANRYFEEHFGESHGRRCYEYLFKRSEPCENCETFKALKTNAPHHWEWTGPDSRSYDIHDFPFTDVDGSKLIMEMGIDITERKKTAEALQRSEERYRNAMDSMLEATAIIGFDWTFIYVNETGARYRRRKKEDIVGHTLFEIHPGFEKTEIFSAYKRSMKERVPQKLVAPFTFPDGTTGWYDMSIQPVPQGIFVLSLDVTERRKAEEATRQANVHNRRLIEASLDPLVTIGPDGKITDVNEAAEKFTGLTRVGLIGTDFSNYFTEPDRARAGYQQVFENGEVHDYALDLKHKNGTIHNVLYNASIYRDEMGKPIGVFAAARDVTEHRRAEEELRVKEAELTQAQKMEAIGRLAGGVAHDLNNMMTVVTGYADRMLKHNDSTTKEEAKEIKTAGERATNLVRQLLAFSRKQILQPKVLDLNTVVTDLMVMLRRVVREDIFVATDLQQGLGCIKADPTQIQQVIMNLVVNARDAMPDGGKLTIRTKNMVVGDAQTGERREVKPGHYVEFSVIDTGCGMDEETQSHVFEPFFTTKATGEGTGLGLPTVYGIVRQSGGFITFESKVGEGTKFVVYFPEANEEVQHKPAPMPTAAVPEGSEMILLVEDEQVLRDFAALELEDLGYKVVKAQNVAEALAAAQRHKNSISLVLSDVILPGLGGKRITDILSAILPEIKVLFMSGYTEKYIVEHGVLTPGTAFLEKPFTSEALAKKVREVLDAPANNHERKNSATNA